MAARLYCASVFGPQQIPPQGAKALVKGLLGGAGGGRPNVSCSLLDSEPGVTELSFANEGGETAVDLRYVIAEERGTVRCSVGDLPAGATTSATLRAGAPLDPVRCVWICSDARAHLHIWSYDGRHKRLGKHGVPTDEACYLSMYG